MKDSGAPVVFPSNKPERNSTSSFSERADITAPFPGFRLFNSLDISFISSLNPEGQPSMTPPMAGPCDSPKVVRQNILPKVFVFTADCILERKHQNKMIYKAQRDTVMVTERLWA